LGVITLNNPKALHALTMDMIECFQDILKAHGTDENIKAILINANPTEKRPAFCAGGDVKAVYQDGIDGTKDPARFFFEEYKVNHAIATSQIPIVSFWDGIVMGGGAGISIHGKYRVATENTLFAMPETAIGLYPDVGSMWWMNQLLQRPVANYLALTGAKIQAADLLYTGLATHYVPSEKLKDLEGELVEATEAEGAKEKDDVVASVLMSYHEMIDSNDCMLAQNQSAINEAFDDINVEGIISNLQFNPSEFSTQTLQTLQKMSPTSLKVTFEALSRGAACQTIGEDLKMEYRISSKFSQPGSDFYEGVRAALVDKDHSPKWNPPTLQEVTDDIVASYFQPLDEDWPIPQPEASKEEQPASKL
jgi:3-hydroxyisobutyryl-CoA hydrolase